MKMKKKTLLCFGVFCFFHGCLADNLWNVDQNRLKMENLNEKFQYQPRFIQDKSAYNYKRPLNYRKYKNNDFRDISYSHYSPRIITAGNIHEKPVIVKESPKLYKSLEDPSLFYKNRIFKNMTEDEKRQRKGIPRNMYSNSIDRYNDPKISKNPDGISIHLNGATVNIKAKDSIMRGNQQNIKSRYDIPYADSVPRHSISMGTTCARCPAERTVIAGKGLDKTVLLPPQLQSCRGSSPATGAEFKVLYGPKIGHLINEGSHIIVGAIEINNQTQQHCQYRYNVVIRRCPSFKFQPGVKVSCPKGMLWGAVCRFSCSNKEHVLRGKNIIFCKDNMEWSAQPPKCGEPKKHWCNLKHILRRGEVTCDTPKFDETIPPHGVPEGSSCTVSCYGEQKVSAKKIITCQSGQWQGRPVCKKSRRRRHKISRTKHLFDKV